MILPVDSTDELQSLLDAKNNVKLERNSQYIVSCRPNTEARHNAALYISSDTSLDLNGSTIILSEDQNCTVIGRLGLRVVDGDPPLSNISVVNGTVVGSGHYQSQIYLGWAPTIDLFDCDNLVLGDLVINDAYQHAIYSRGNYCQLYDVVVNGSVGSGLHLSGDSWTIGDVDVFDVRNFAIDVANGNPFIVALTNSTIGFVKCFNFGFGVKFQNGCENLQVRSVVAVAGPNNFANGQTDVSDFLVKIQGFQDPVQPLINRNIQIDSIIAQGGPFSGLYIFFSEDVRIGSYRGINNGQDPNQDALYRSDIVTIDANDMTFDKVRAEGFHQFSLNMHTGNGTLVCPDFAVDRDLAPTIVVTSGKAILNGVDYES